MSTVKYPRLLTMDKAAENCIKTTLKLANSVMAIAGIAILMYSVWMIVVCLREYYKYPFSWFLWGSIGTGIIFCFLACIGHIAASTKNNHLLSSYIVFMFLVILVECLITADICLNDDWDKDFPKDHTKRFNHFMHFVDNNIDNFRCLCVLIAFSQGISFFLAMVLRTMHPNPRRSIEDEEAKHPFLDHNSQPPSPLPYALGHPDPYYYPSPPPYVHGYGYTPDVPVIDKGEHVAPTLKAPSKDC
ncbi:hypothetical protein SOVF_042090 [Spinacia oleracea]|nr:hypothetical protein SOVF_042090 [Spinacia oleracea]